MPQRPIRRWTPAEDEVLRTCGEPDGAISRRLGRAITAVQSRRKYLGLRKPKPPPQPRAARERTQAPEVSPEARRRGAVRRRVEDMHEARRLREAVEW